MLRVIVQSELTHWKSRGCAAFNGGLRLCLGMDLAFLEIKTMLAHMLSTYHVSKVDPLSQLLICSHMIMMDILLVCALFTCSLCSLWYLRLLECDLFSICSLRSMPCFPGARAARRIRSHSHLSYEARTQCCVHPRGNQSCS